MKAMKYNESEIMNLLMNKTLRAHVTKNGKTAADVSARIIRVSVMGEWDEYEEDDADVTIYDDKGHCIRFTFEAIKKLTTGRYIEKCGIYTTIFTLAA